MDVQTRKVILSKPRVHFHISSIRHSKAPSLAWLLPRKDSNLDKQIQSLPSYH